MTEPQDVVSPEQQQALDVARQLIAAGIPVFAAPPCAAASGGTCSAHPHGREEFHLPNKWQLTVPSEVWLQRWRPGWGLAAVGGHAADFLDEDTHHGGDAAVRALQAAGHWPRVYGVALTPSEGQHFVIAPLGERKATPAAPDLVGLDYQGGAPDGEGRGFVWIAPTVKRSKNPATMGQLRPYRWLQAPDLEWLSEGGDESGEMLRERIVAARLARSAGRQNDERAARTFTEPQARAFVRATLDRVRVASIGSIEEAGNAAAVQLSHFVPDFWSAEQAHAMIMAELAHTAYDPNGPSSWTADKFWPILRGQSDRAPQDWKAVRVEAPARQVKAWTVRAADREIDDHAARVAGATPEKRETVLRRAALRLGHFVPHHLDTETATARLTAAAGECGMPADLAAAIISSGLEQGSAAPYPVKPDGRAAPATPPPAAPGELEIKGAAAMAYWLQQEMGRGRLAGYFLRHGLLVHTPSEGESGYVDLRGKGSDGPAEIREVIDKEVAARVQFGHTCFRWRKDETETGEIKWEKDAAMFPTSAATMAVSAPDMLPHVRPLRGVTHTPLVRADGSYLAEPGYDTVTGYLFLPGEGVEVPHVPERPSAAEVAAARGLLDRMTADFPWGGPDDRANYYGLLLTPLLRHVVVPTYKMFGINAHQPGSGKTLLAELAGIIHGRVMRSEMPEDEAEIRKQSTAILAGTSAPLIHIDNVTGIIRSAVLAGLLTAGPEALTDRELGTSRNIRAVNDRVWVLTGNNMSLGGDLVRRTVMINIDPDMPNPETRTAFGIPDITSWAREHRNNLLAALLTLVRAWVAEGMPEPARKQSDGFARWSRVVAGVLSVAGVPGTFDAETGKRAAAGGDDDGLSAFLEAVRAWRPTGQHWTAAELLGALSEGGTALFATASGFDRSALPDPVAEKVHRMGAAGAATSFGRWLRNREGRWVPGQMGGSLVLRCGEKTKAGVPWKVEYRP